MSVIRLPLYEGYAPLPAAVELATPLDRDALEPIGRGKGRKCTLCPLGVRAIRSPCVTAEGRPGGLLVVGESPSKEDDDNGRPFYGQSGVHIKKIITSVWQGPIAFDNGIRCYPGREEIKDKYVDQCRGYLTKTIEEVAPTRIIAVGSWAAKALFDRSVPPLSSRRAYAWLQGKKPTPVFFVMNPTAALRNRFLAKWFESDVRHALTCEDPPPGPWSSEATVITSENLALLAERELMAQRWVSFDVETAGAMWNDEFRIISTALCGSDDDDAWVWPADVMVRLPPELEAALRLGARIEGELFAAIKKIDPRLAVLLRVLTSRKLPKVGQNVKYDQLAFRSLYGMKVQPVIIDTRLQRKLLEPDADGSLGVMAELVGMGGHKQEAQEAMKATVTRVKRAFSAKPLKKDANNREKKIAALELEPAIEAALRLGGRPESFMFDLIDKDLLHRYNAADSVVTKKLALHHETQIAREPALQRMWDIQVRPASIALERVEGWGVGASKDAVNAFDSYLEKREIDCRKQLDAYDTSINWNSDPQVRVLLFEKLKLTKNPRMLTDSGLPSVSKDALKDLAQRTGHPLPLALKEFNWVTHLRDTYSRGLYPHIRADNRIHPNIKLDGARSGRTSCTDPNLQNIPRAQTVEGKMARGCFVARPGYKLFEADYSQLELRVAAMLSGDKVMLKIFEDGIDYHLRTAQMVSQIAWGIPPESVTDEHRSYAKTVNFGVLYGKTAHTLAQEWGVTKEKAQQIVDAIMGNFAQLERWCRERREEVMRTGYVWTWWQGQKARRRPLTAVADQDDKRASVARNGAVNTPIQGTASDFCIASLSQAVQWIEEDAIEEDVKLVLAVHDSLMFEVKDSMIRETSNTVNDIMLGHDSAGVPVVADFKYGDSWGTMHDAHLIKGELVHSPKCKLCDKKKAA